MRPKRNLMKKISLAIERIDNECNHLINKYAKPKHYSANPDHTEMGVGGNRDFNPNSLEDHQHSNHY